MKRTTFRALYEAEKRKPTSAQKFVRHVAALTGKTESTVRQWVSGRQVPDLANRKLIAQELGVDINSLFPETRLPYHK